MRSGPRPLHPPRHLSPSPRGAKAPWGDGVGGKEGRGEGKTQGPLDSARSARWAWLLSTLCVLGLPGCLKAWDEGGPWACSENSVCPEGYVCDDEVCCKPGSTPACPRSEER